MKILKFGLVLFTFITFSCGPTVKTTKTNTLNLSNYKTFAYLPNSNFDKNNELGNKNETIGKGIIENINLNMKKNGYTIDRNRPDLLVLVSTTQNPADEAAEPVYATYPNYYSSNYLVSPYYDKYYYNGYSDFVGFTEYEVNLSAYNTGTLIIRLVDTKTRIVVWRGSAFDANFVDEGPVEIAKFVDDIFAEFPQK